tara:strand:+ start:3574 stop:4572 length:999 start_codon:yes stop_codon:yes gene_type:complete
MHGLVVCEDPRKRHGDLELKLENPLGFFESERLVETNEALLQGLGCQWDRPPLLPACWDKPPLLDALQPHRSRLSIYALERSWVDKDPRLCITYPAYMHILLRRIPLVLTLREPLAVATSLHARNGFSLNRGLVLWWIYNHHISSQLCSDDLLVLYSDLLNFDDQSLCQRLGPFLELHNHLRPSDDQARILVSTLIRPEFNRSEVGLNEESRARINPLLLKVCNQAYKNIIEAGDQLSCYQEQFNSVPRVILECSSRDQLLPEADVRSLQNRLSLIESEMCEVVNSLEQRDRDCASLSRRLKDLLHSRSWKITAPLRAFVDCFRLGGKSSHN